LQIPRPSAALPKWSPTDQGLFHFGEAGTVLTGVPGRPGRCWHGLSGVADFFVNGAAGCFWLVFARG
jgi:hypothetical protein